jgi:hypothetical protein
MMQSKREVNLFYTYAVFRIANNSERVRDGYKKAGIGRR